MALLTMAVAGCGDAEPSTMVEPGVPAEATTGASTPVQAAPPGDGVVSRFTRWRPNH